MASNEQPVPLPPSPLPSEGEPSGMRDDVRLSWWATVLLAPLALLPGLVTSLLHGGGVVYSGRWWDGWDSLSYPASQLAWHGLSLALGVVAAEWLAPRGWRRPYRWAAGLGAGTLVCLPAWFWVVALSPPVRPTHGGFLHPLGLPSLTLTLLASFGWALSGWCSARSLGRPGSVWRRLPLVGAMWRVVAMVPLLGSAWLDTRSVLSHPDVALALNPWPYFGTVMGAMALTGFLFGLVLANGLRLGRPRGEWRWTTALAARFARLRRRVTRILS